MVLFVNRYAAGGTGLQKLQIILPELNARLGHFRVCIMNGLDTTRRTIEREVFSGETRFVAAGGDGTVNFIANTLIPGQAMISTSQYSIVLFTRGFRWPSISAGRSHVT